MLLYATVCYFRLGLVRIHKSAEMAVDFRVFFYRRI